jgi:hypothetical protein
MFGIPRIVLFFGSLGLLPFVAGVLISSGGFYADMGDPNDGGYSLIITKDGLDILVDYGKIILTFSSGVLLGVRGQNERTNRYYRLLYFDAARDLCVP